MPYDWNFLKGVLFDATYAAFLHSVYTLVRKVNENEADIQELISRLEECEKDHELKK